MVTEHATARTTPGLRGLYRVEAGRSAGAPGGTCSCLVQFVADGYERASNGEVRGVEVDVTPSQSEDFTASHPGVGGDAQCGVVPVIACRGQECTELLGAPHRDVLLESGRRFGA
jgi:hypothetical protein